MSDNGEEQLTASSASVKGYTWPGHIVKIFAPRILSLSNEEKKQHPVVVDEEMIEISKSPLMVVAASDEEEDVQTTEESLHKLEDVEQQSLQTSAAVADSTTTPPPYNRRKSKGSSSLTKRRDPPSVEDESVKASSKAYPLTIPTGSLSAQSQQQQQQPITVRYTATKPPKETLQAVYKVGMYKAALPLRMLIVQSFMAGIYIAMAGHLYLAVGGGILGSALFPTGLIAVILTSAELFTGDALVFVASVLGGKVHITKLLRNWTVAWICNFCGCLFWAFIMAYLSDSIKDLNQVDFAVAVAIKKAHKSWLSIFLKGIGANFMVCVGIWQGTSAEEVSGKILALWFPIAAFVMMGFDHCIANQFLIPLGMMLGAKISIYELLIGALLPATIGNVVGGGLLVGAVYWYVFDSMASSKQVFATMLQGIKRGGSNGNGIRSTPPSKQSSRDE